MAGEIQLPHSATGVVLYAVMRTTLGKAVKTSDGSLVTYATANLSQYVITLTEQGTASRYYVGDVPAGVVAGAYEITAYVRAGGSPAEGDTTAGVEKDFQWDGTAVVPLSSRTKPADTQAAVTLVTTTTNLTNAAANGDLTATMKASINTEADTALADAKAAYAAAIEAAILDEGDATALLAAIAAKVEQFLINEGDASATLAAIAAAVWANVGRTLTSGAGIVLAKGVGVTGFNDLSAAQVNTEVDVGLADYDAPTHAEMTAELATADDAVLAALASAFAIVNSTLTTIAGYIDTETTAGAIAAAVLNAVAASYNVAGSIGEKINAVGGGTAPTAAAIRVEMDTNSTKLIAIKAKTDTIGAGAFAVISPSSANGAVFTFEFTHGDDYVGPPGNVAPSVTDLGGTWPDLTGATVVLNISRTLAIAGVVTNAGTASQVVTFSMSKTAFSSLTPAQYDADIRATLSGGHVETLGRGGVRIRTSQAP